MKYLILSLLFTSCTISFGSPSRSSNPKDVRDRRIERCVHKLIDKGVVFTEAATICEEKIYAKRKV